MRIVHESERVAQLRQIIKSLDTKELEFLQEYIGQERQGRKKDVFEEWINCLEVMVSKSLH